MTFHKTNNPTASLWLPGFFLLLTAWCNPLLAADPSNENLPVSHESVSRHNELNLAPAIGIIIDDLGNLKHRDTRAIRLPGNVTYAFLPHTPYASTLATLAHKLNKEVMLHLPMQSMEHNQLGPGGLTVNMTEHEFVRQLDDDLDAIPYAVGLNNHMGSLLTQHPGSMAWLMQEISRHKNLYFVDSFTTDASIAQQLANEYWIPNLRRDVFLDDDRDPEMIRMQFERLLGKARSNGIALAIGHPYPETLAMLERELPELEAQGIQLLSVSRLLRHYSQRTKTWQASLSR